jgi:hypothetical protein
LFRQPQLVLLWRFAKPMTNRGGDTDREKGRRAGKRYPLRRIASVRPICNPRSSIFNMQFAILNFQFAIPPPTQTSASNCASRSASLHGGGRELRRICSLAMRFMRTRQGAEPAARFYAGWRAGGGDKAGSLANVLPTTAFSEREKPSPPTVGDGPFPGSQAVIFAWPRGVLALGSPLNFSEDRNS